MRLPHLAAIRSGVGRRAVRVRAGRAAVDRQRWQRIPQIGRYSPTAAHARGGPGDGLPMSLATQALLLAQGRWNGAQRNRTTGPERWRSTGSSAAPLRPTLPCHESADGKPWAIAGTRTRFSRAGTRSPALATTNSGSKSQRPVVVVRKTAAARDAETRSERERRLGLVAGAWLVRRHPVIRVVAGLTRIPATLHLRRSHR